MHLFAIVAILISGALSSYWAFLVPIFQADDEPAHFDYAVSILTAGRLINRGDGESTWIASPVTQYLLRASDFDRIAGHSPIRVAPGYGSFAYYRKLDSNAPDVMRHVPPNGRVNYIVRLYPFGFYALEALWMRGVLIFTNSLAAAFFGARLLCVFLMMAGLYFNYRTALLLGIPRTTSAAIVAAIGIFPMTSTISSYVQPDNLAYALVSAAIFFAAKLRGSMPTPTSVALLGISLGLLAITKYQFFLTAALPALALTAAQFLRGKHSSAQVSSTFLVLLGPSIALIAIQHFFVDVHTSLGRTTPSDISTAYLSSVAANGVLPALRYVASSLFSAFFGCFATGLCAAGFWQVLGWGDTPIVILNPGVELFTRVSIAFLTVLAAAVVVFSCTRSLARLARVAFRGYGHVAFRLAANDPVLNSYLGFAAFIFALYVATNDVFGLSGRHWYPYIFAAFLCFVWYAPRSLWRRCTHLPTILAYSLLGYSVVAASYAVADLTQRYYGPGDGRYVAYQAPSKAPGRARGVFWPLQKKALIFAAPPGTFSFVRGSRIAVSGFAVNSANEGASRVSVLVDGSSPLPVLTRQYRSGIGEITHSVMTGYSGFGSVIDTAALPEGPHRVDAFALDDRDPVGGLVVPHRVFFLTAPGGRFSRRYLQFLQHTQSAPGSFQTARSCAGSQVAENGVLTMPQGSVPLFRWRLKRVPNQPDYVAAWVVADGRPYPSKFDPVSGTFFAKVLTKDLPDGFHPVTAYALSGDNTIDRVGQVGIRVIRPVTTLRPLLSEAPGCADPFLEMAPTPDTVL